MHHTWHDSISMIFRADGRLAAGWLGAQMAAQAQQRGREAGYGVLLGAVAGVLTVGVSHTLAFAAGAVAATIHHQGGIGAGG